ncbi:MAG: FAD-binding oxidoreductase, partial [Natronomonas sp.]|nr:FAD-binding oxidoreductase [Natronomonas sp.]
VVQEDVAYTSRTPDGNPVVGWTDTPGFSIAALHSRGVQYAPAIGDVITRQLVDDDPTTHYPDISISRFDGYTDDRP